MDTERGETGAVGYSFLMGYSFINETDDLSFRLLKKPGLHNQLYQREMPQERVE